MPVLEVERAGRLVAEEHVGPLGDGARDGDALLLAARELRREVIEPIAEADERERLARVERVVGDLGDQRDVLARGQAGDQVVELEDEADVAPPVARQLVLVGVGEVGAAIDDAAGGADVEAAQDVEQRRLAAARGAEQDDQLALEQIEVDAAQRGTSTSPMR